MDFQSLQKLRFFLAIVFPFVGRNLITPEQAEWLLRHRAEIVTHTLRNSKLAEPAVLNETLVRARA